MVVTSGFREVTKTDNPMDSRKSKVANNKMNNKNPFEYQKPTEEQIQKITEVREACKALYDLLLTLPECRERSLAITNLEQVSMWTNKGIVFN